MARPLMTSSPSTAEAVPAQEATTGWGRVILLRPVVEAGRVVMMLVLLGGVALFMTSGALQLYADWSTITSEEIEGLVPSWAELQAAWEVHRPTLMDAHVPATLWATVNGLALAVGLGLLLAAIMDLAPPVRWVLYPVLVLTQTIPTFALAVILILLFGFGFGPKIVVVVLFCFFPITVNTLSGLQNADPVHMKLLRSMGANPLQAWWKVRLPAAMPSFFSGLRLAATYSVVGAVIGEYVGAGDGLGKFLQRSYRSFRTDQVFLSVGLIAALSVGLVLFVSLTEVLALRWRYVGQRNTLTDRLRRLWRWLRT